MAGEESKTSVQDIAKMLLTPSGEADTTSEELDEDNSPSEGTSTEDLTTDDDTAGDEPETVEQEQEEVEGDADDAADDDAKDDQDAGFLDIRDDDTIDVMIDGKLETRTIGELKKAISLAGATEKRLQEATEVRKTAIAERTVALENLAAQERIIAASFNDLEETLFKSVIPPPNPKMKDTNPAGYLRHKEAYDEDQQRIVAAKQAVQKKVTEFSEQRSQRLKEYGEMAAQQISKTIPELTDPKKSSQMLERLVGTAKAYGYSDQEISGALDPRMFHLVRDAMAYRELTSRSKETNVTDLSSQRNKAPRKLRSGNTKAASLVSAKSKQQQEAKSVAARTGSIKDVARTLLAPAKVK